MDTYHINIAGVDRDLKMYSVNEHLDIAAFIMFGDVEVTEKAASALLKLCPEHLPRARRSCFCRGKGYSARL